MSRPVRILVIEDGEIFVAQCLEYDIAAQGRSKDEAERRVVAALRKEQAEAKERGEADITLPPAPKAFHAFYDSLSVTKTEVMLAAA